MYAKAPKPILWQVGDQSLKKTCLHVRVELQGFCKGRFRDVLLPPHYVLICLFIEAGLQTKAGEEKLTGCCTIHGPIHFTALLQISLTCGFYGL